MSEVVQLQQTYRKWLPWYVINWAFPLDNISFPILCVFSKYVPRPFPEEYGYRDRVMMFVSFYQPGFWMFPAQCLVTVDEVRIGQTQTMSTQCCLSSLQLMMLCIPGPSSLI